MWKSTSLAALCATMTIGAAYAEKIISCVMLIGFLRLGGNTSSPKKCSLTSKPVIRTGYGANWLASDFGTSTNPIPDLHVRSHSVSYRGATTCPELGVSPKRPAHSQSGALDPLRNSRCGRTIGIHKTTGNFHVR